MEEFKPNLFANDQQIGGTHYRSAYQHWDFVVDNELNYLQGCGTKYVSRWRKKNGIQDLTKSLHYIAKLIEVETKKRYAFSWWPKRKRPPVNWLLLNHFCISNNLDERESYVIENISFWQTTEDLKRAELTIKSMISEEENRNDT